MAKLVGKVVEAGRILIEVVIGNDDLSARASACESDATSVEILRLEGLYKKNFDGIVCIIEASQTTFFRF